MSAAQLHRPTQLDALSYAVLCISVFAACWTILDEVGAMLRIDRYCIAAGALALVAVSAAIRARELSAFPAIC